MVQNQFAWWFQVNEKLSDSLDFSEDPLVSLDWNKLSLNWGWIYQSFSEQSDSSNEKESKLWEKEKPESDSPYFPIIKNLFESWHIDEKLFQETVEKFNNVDKGEELTELLKIVNNLSDSDVKDKILKSFNKKEKTKEKNFNKTEFFKDSTALNMDLDKWVGWLEIMLADNYISINNKDWTENKQRDLSSSMNATLNIILRWSSNQFRENNGDLIDKIKSENVLDKKYVLLKELYKEDLKRDAELWWKKAKEEINSKKTSLIEEAKNITLKIKEAEKIADKWEKEKTLKKLNEDKQIVVNEWQWIDNFEAEVEALSGWKIDKWSEKAESKNKII